MANNTNNTNNNVEDNKKSLEDIFKQAQEEMNQPEEEEVEETVESTANTLRLIYSSRPILEEVQKDVLEYVNFTTSEIEKVADTDSMYCLKWDTDDMTLDQYIVAEGLLRHRDAIGLNKLLFGNLNGDPLQVAPEDAEMLECIKFIACKDENQKKEVIIKVLNVARIPGDKINFAYIPIKADQPAMVRPTVVLSNLTDEETKAVNTVAKHVNRAKKVNNALNRANTYGIATATTICRDIMEPVAGTAGRFAGLAGSTALNMTYKGGMAAINEGIQNIVRADWAHNPDLEGVKEGIGKLRQQWTGNKKKTFNSIEMI